MSSLRGTDPADRPYGMAVVAEGKFDLNSGRSSRSTRYTPHLTTSASDDPADARTPATF
jgi:hypothetical protein